MLAFPRVSTLQLTKQEGLEETVKGELSARGHAQWQPTPAFLACPMGLLTGDLGPLC